MLGVNLFSHLKSSRHDKLFMPLMHLSFPLGRIMTVKLVGSRCFLPALTFLISEHLTKLRWYFGIVQFSVTRRFWENSIRSGKISDL